MNRALAGILICILLTACMTAQTPVTEQNTQSTQRTNTQQKQTVVSQNKETLEAPDVYEETLKALEEVGRYYGQMGRSGVSVIDGYLAGNLSKEKFCNVTKVYDIGLKDAAQKRDKIQTSELLLKDQFEQLKGHLGVAETTISNGVTKIDTYCNGGSAVDLTQARAKLQDADRFFSTWTLTDMRTLLTVDPSYDRGVFHVGDTIKRGQYSMTLKSQIDDFIPKDSWFVVSDDHNAGFTEEELDDISRLYFAKTETKDAEKLVEQELMDKYGSRLPAKYIYQRLEYQFIQPKENLNYFLGEPVPNWDAWVYLKNTNKTYHEYIDDAGMTPTGNFRIPKEEAQGDGYLIISKDCLKQDDFNYEEDRKIIAAIQKGEICPKTFIFELTFI